jgi:hypothetical protein
MGGGLIFKPKFQCAAMERQLGPDISASWLAVSSQMRYTVVAFVTYS